MKGNGGTAVGQAGCIPGVAGRATLWRGEVTDVTSIFE
jgi:hypothetical protein